MKVKKQIAWLLKAVGCLMEVNTKPGWTHVSQKVCVFRVSACYLLTIHYTDNREQSRIVSLFDVFSFLIDVAVENIYNDFDIV